MLKPTHESSPFKSQYMHIKWYVSSTPICTFCSITLHFHLHIGIGECSRLSERTLHDIGHNLTKGVQFGFWKPCAEFTKWQDPELPFYYHMSSHPWFHEGPLPWNWIWPKKVVNVWKTTMVGGTSYFVPRRATMPVQESWSVCLHWWALYWDLSTLYSASWELMRCVVPIHLNVTTWVWDVTTDIDINSSSVSDSVLLYM